MEDSEAASDSQPLLEFCFQAIFYNCTREAKKERGPQRHCRARSQQWWQSLQEPLGDQIEAGATGTGHGGWGAESYANSALVLEKGPSIYYSCI